MLRNLRDFGFGSRNKHFEKMIEEELRDFIDLVQSKHVEGVCHDGKVVVPTVFYSFFLNFILQLLFGTRLPPSLHHKLRELAYAAYRFQLSVDPTTGAINMTPWLRHLASQWFGFDDCKKSNAFMKSFIKERVQEHKDTFLTDALRDFCDVYLKEMENKNMSDAQHWFSEEQMVMTFWDLLFPTSMATTATLGFAIEFLLLYPQVQVRVHQEIDSVVGRSRLPTLDDRKNLPYTEAVLREVMRRETLAALAIPHRCTEDTYFNGYFIPKTLHYLFHRAPLGGRTNSVNVIVEPLPIGLGLNNCIRVDPWSRLSIPEGRKLFLVGDLRLSHPINKQTVTIWVSANLSSPLSLRKNLVVLALYQYSRPSPLSEADNIANPRGGVANWRPTRGPLC
ncbi:hypothetical protein J6590_060557 [Homalodisca vitripennis]|nr:hypothetical protein J6590_060557 [Homalodisca vitripennis]